MFRFSPRILVGVFFLLMLAGALPVQAAGLAGLLDGARRDQEKQEYAAALAKLDQAAASDPDEPLVHFNRGNVLYRQGAYDQALAAYDRAIALGGDEELLARARFNRGNAGYRLAGQLAASDPEAALARLKESEEFYRQALAAKPELAGAARNFELARLQEQALAARKQQQQQNGQGEGQQGNKAMQDLAREQQELAERSKQAAENGMGRQQGDAQGDGQEQSREKLKERQQELSERTAEQSRQLEPGSEADKAAKEALARQQEAAEKLKQEKYDEAARAQQQAAELLRQAVGGKGEKKPETGEKMPEEQQGQQGQQAGEQAEQAKSPEVAAKDGEQPPSDDTARRILARERQQQRQRRSAVGPRGGWVEKDW